MNKLFIIIIFGMNLYALDIIYDQRVPYIKENENSIAGLVATPLIKALDEANITYTLKNRPSKRHLREIKANKKAICAVGWFKNQKREEFAKFSKSLYQDKPIGILTNIDNDISNKITFDELFSINNLSVLIKDSYSYGSFIDKKLKTLKVKKTKTTNVNMIAMIAKKRATFMFISFEEAQDIIKNHKYKNNIKFIQIKDAPKGSKRYLICSKLVDDNIIDKLNKNIK